MHAESAVAQTAGVADLSRDLLCSGSWAWRRLSIHIVERHHLPAAGPLGEDFFQLCIENAIGLRVDSRSKGFIPTQPQLSLNDGDVGSYKFQSSNANGEMRAGIDGAEDPGVPLFKALAPDEGRPNNVGKEAILRRVSSESSPERGGGKAKGRFPLRETALSPIF